MHSAILQFLLAFSFVKFGVCCPELICTCKILACIITLKFISVFLFFAICLVNAIGKQEFPTENIKNFIELFIYLLVAEYTKLKDTKLRKM